MLRVTGYDLDKIEEDIKELEDSFKSLKGKVMNSFQEQQIEVGDIVYKLTDLPAAEISQHKFFIKENLQELERCTKHKPLFSRLNGYWNYLSPQLLYHFITTFFPGLKSLVKDKKSYDRNLFYFRNLTLLRLFCKIDNEYVEPPEGFSKIVAKFESNVTEDPTLQHVENFRDMYARHHRLRDFALMLAARGETGSFIVSFVIPNSIIEILEENIPTDLLQEFGVTQLTIAGKCIYPDFVETTTVTQSLAITDIPYSPANSSEVPGKLYYFFKIKLIIVFSFFAVMMDYVHARCVNLSVRFRHLKKLTVESCEKEQISICRIAKLIKSLPAYRTNQEVQFLSDTFEDLELCNNHSEVFIAIKLHWKYFLWYQLLDLFIERLDLQEVKEDMNAYKESLRAFFNEVRLLDFIKYEQRKRVRPPNFCELTADFEWPEDATLIMLEEFKQQYLQCYNLHQYVMFLGFVQYEESFSITWFIPDVLIKLLKAIVPDDLFEQFNICSLYIAGECIYKRKVIIM